MANLGKEYMDVHVLFEFFCMTEKYRIILGKNWEKSKSDHITSLLKVLLLQEKKKVCDRDPLLTPPT